MDRESQTGKISKSLIFQRREGDGFSHRCSLFMSRKLANSRSPIQVGSG